MRKTTRLLWMLALPIVLGMGISACSSDEDVTTDPSSFQYSAYVFGSEDSQMLTLTDLTSPLTSATASASWLTVTPQADLNSDGHPVITITSTSPSTDGAEATITATAQDGSRATITVKHSALGLGDAYSGANDEWLTSWWTCETVKLQGIAAGAQKAPWTVEGGVNIPEEVRKQVTPSQGWEMAFSYLNDDSMTDVRFFGLYNKWTGQMRVYTYVDNPTGWGSQLLINTYLGLSHHNDMYPFYHVHEYGIPTSHVLGTSLLRTARLVGTDNDQQKQTFQTWLSPFQYSSSLVRGWYCFEFDMSGYVPEGKDWLKKDEDTSRFKFFAATSSEAKISLKGSLRGDISGTFSDPEIIQHGGATATSGIVSALGGGLSALSGLASNSIKGSATYANLMKNGGSEGIGGYLNPIKYWGGFACSIAGPLMSFIGSQLEEPVTYDTIPGKIDLTLDATISLDGYMKSVTSNSHSPLAVSPAAIYSANGANGHVGKGVWGLAEDPVVYIDKDDIISSQRSFNLLCKKDGYSISTFADYDARIVYAFDPTSVKINLNQDLFRNIQDVTVTANVGVLPNYVYGHTDPYRRMLVLGERPTFSLAPGKTSGTVSLSAKSTPMVTQVALDDLADGDYETASNCTVVAQKTSDGTAWQRFHGRVIEMAETGKQIIVDPQVYIPYTVDDKGKCTGIGYPTAPDFVVRVDVQFTALDDNGERKAFQYGKLFIPQVKIVDYDEMSQVYSRLKDYSKKCENNQAVGSLANDSNVKVRFPGGHRLIGKSLRMLSRIMD